MNSNVEIHRGFAGNEISITRHNTKIDGYIPVIREVEGVLSLIQGISNTAFGCLMPATNEEMKLNGYAQLKDGVINISHSPIVYGAIGYFFGTLMSK